MTSKQRIIAKALEFLKAEPHGIRYSEFVKQINDALPDIPKNTIHGTLWNLDAQRPAEVYKPARGLYLHASFKPSAAPESAKPVSPAPRKVKEEQF